MVCRSCITPTHRPTPHCPRRLCGELVCHPCRCAPPQIDSVPRVRAHTHFLTRITRSSALSTCFALCSPHTLQFSAAKPAVRVCSRCYLRVDLLNSMSAVVDGITKIRASLPPAMFDYFKHEVLGKHLPLAISCYASDVLTHNCIRTTTHADINAEAVLAPPKSASMLRTSSGLTSPAPATTSGQDAFPTSDSTLLQTPSK